MDPTTKPWENFYLGSGGWKIAATDKQGLAIIIEGPRARAFTELAGHLQKRFNTGCLSVTLSLKSTPDSPAWMFPTTQGSLRYLSNMATLSVSFIFENGRAVMAIKTRGDLTITTDGKSCLVSEAMTLGVLPIKINPAVQNKYCPNVRRFNIDIGQQPIFKRKR